MWGSFYNTHIFFVSIVLTQILIIVIIKCDTVAIIYGILHIRDIIPTPKGVDIVELRIIVIWYVIPCVNTKSLFYFISYFVAVVNAKS